MPPVRPPRAHGGVVRRRKRELEQLHLLMGWPSYAEGSRSRYPLYVLNTILGGTMSSRLFQEVREKRGLVYSIYAFPTSFADSGVFGIYAGTGEQEVAHPVSRL